MLLPRRAASRLSKGPTALLIDSSTGGTLASWGNSTHPKFRGLEVLSPQDSLWSSTHEGSTRVTHGTLRNSASVELQGKKCCLYKMPYVAAPIWVPRWRHCKFYALRATSYRRTYKSQKIFFFGSRVTRFGRDPSRHVETPTWIFTRRSTSEGGTRNRLLIAFLEESLKSTSSISTSKLRSDSSSGAEASGSQKNKMTARKGTLSNQPWLMHVTPIALLCSWVLQPIKVRCSLGLTSRSVPNGKGPLRNPLQRIS